jgi:hypothetical protein
MSKEEEIVDLTGEITEDEQAIKEHPEAPKRRSKAPKRRRKDEEEEEEERPEKRQRRARKVPLCEVCDKPRENGKCPDGHMCDGCQSLNAPNGVKYWRQGWKLVIEGQDNEERCYCAKCYLEKKEQQEEKKEQQEEKKEQPEEPQEDPYTPLPPNDDVPSCDICGNDADLFFCESGHCSCKDCYRKNFNANAFATIGAKDHINQCNGYLCKHPMGDIEEVMKLVDPDNKWQLLMLQKQQQRTAGEETLVICSTPDCKYMEFVENPTGLMVCGVCNHKTCRACGRPEGHAGELCQQARARDPKDENAELLKELGAKKCHCGCLLERVEACNKVKCPGCHNFMCIVCGDVLDANRPYFHYDRCSGEGCTVEGCNHCPKWPGDDWRNH